MKETIDFLHEQVKALQKKVDKLQEENNILFDYADCKMVEGCEEATRVLNKIEYNNVDNFDYEINKLNK